jgi:hypothetical protein
MYTISGGASSYSALSLGQVQVGTTLGVVVPPNRVVVPLGQPDALSFLAGHRHRGGGAPLAASQAEFRLLFFTFLTTFANMLTLQVFHHHVQVC